MQLSRFAHIGRSIAGLVPMFISKNQAAFRRRSFMFRYLCRSSAMVAIVAIPLVAGGQEVNYNRAEQLLDWNTTLITFGDEVRPQWLLDGARFWYRNKTVNGAEFVLIDPVKNTRSLVFDNTRLAAAMSVANDTSYDPA